MNFSGPTTINMTKGNLTVENTSVYTLYLELQRDITEWVM